MSDWKVATISKISIDFDGSRTIHMVKLALHEKNNHVVLPSMGWGPKPNHRFGEKTIGKFDIDHEEDEEQRDDVGDAQNVLDVDWTTLREVRVVN
jgi:hypothetical protein